MTAYGRSRNTRRRGTPDRYELVDRTVTGRLHGSDTSDRDSQGTKIKVENLHYELTEDDLDVSEACLRSRAVIF